MAPPVRRRRLPHRGDAERRSAVAPTACRNLAGAARLGLPGSARVLRGALSSAPMSSHVQQRLGDTPMPTSADVILRLSELDRLAAGVDYRSYEFDDFLASLVRALSFDNLL